MWDHLTATTRRSARPSYPSRRIHQARARWRRTKARLPARGGTQERRVAANVGRSQRAFGNTARHRTSLLLIDNGGEKWAATYGGSAKSQAVTDLPIGTCRGSGAMAQLRTSKTHPHPESARFFDAARQSHPPTLVGRSFSRELPRWPPAQFAKPRIFRFDRIWS